MKTIQNKISTSYLSLIIIVPILILILFNVAFRFIILENTREDHNNAMEMIQILIREEINQVTTNETGSVSDNLRTFLESLNRSIRLTQKTQDTEILLIHPTGKMIYPKNISESTLAKELLKAIILEVQETSYEENSEKKYGQERYLVSYKTLKTTPLKTDQNVMVLISPLNAADGIISQLNLFLIAIVFFTILLGYFITLKVSREISKPIIEASRQAKSIAKGQWAIIDQPGNSKEIHSLYESLNHMSHKLKEKNEDQNRYFQNISHDLRTPLMSIQGYAEGIEKGIFDNNLEAASIIKKESLRLKSFVDQLLTLSKFEQHYEMSNEEVFVIKEVIDAMIIRYKGLTNDKGMNMLLNCPDSLELSLDIHVFEKVMANILSNAITYGRHLITIDVYEQSPYIHIEVQDDGPGVEEPLLACVFDRFEKGSTGNFGLGLAIVASAMTAVNGKVSVVNNQSGACFKLSFLQK